MYIIRMWVTLESLVPSFTQDHKADLLTLLNKLKKRGIILAYISIKEFSHTILLKQPIRIF